MKTVIDISKENYSNIEPFLNGETIKGGFNIFKVLEIIKNGIPLEQYEFNLLKELREEIAKEAELAYADFDAYKENVLEAETDDLPDDDFRYGMERCMVIINNTINHLKKEGMT